MKSKFLINASNLHVGGGVQVATSVIGEITLLDKIPKGLDFWVSSEVDENLNELGFHVDRLPGYKVINSYGIGFLFSSAIFKMQEYEKVLTVFGPLYSIWCRPYSIVGFAQAWIIYPNEVKTCNENWMKKYKRKIKFSFQSIFFKRADHLVVELEHVKNGLIENKIAQDSNISIIKNCFSSIFTEEKKWKSIELKKTSNKLNLGFIGRNYSHKNTNIFPAVIKALKYDFGIDADIFVTFNQDEWDACSLEFKKNIKNVGVLSVAQCPSFYRSVDGIIFPSLLESFSATPLETMIMKVPLFASDRKFNHDICHDLVSYFDPNDPRSIAESIVSFYSKNKEEQILLVEKAAKHALNFSNAKCRASQYINLLLS